MSSVAVLFIGDLPYVLEGFRNSRTHIRGRVVGSDWPFLLKKGITNWSLHSATSLRSCGKHNKVATVAKDDIRWIKVPENMFGDPLMLTKWAQLNME